MKRATPLILDSFKKVEFRGRTGYYCPETQTWTGENLNQAELLDAHDSSQGRRSLIQPTPGSLTVERGITSKYKSGMF